MNTSITRLVSQLSVLAEAMNDELHMPKPSSVVMEKQNTAYRTAANHLLNEMVRRHRARIGRPRVPEITL